MSLRQLIWTTLITSFVASLAALYVAYLIGRNQVQTTVNSNPLLKLFAGNS